VCNITAFGRKTSPPASAQIAKPAQLETSSDLCRVIMSARYQKVQNRLASEMGLLKRFEIWLLENHLRPLGPPPEDCDALSGFRIYPSLTAAAASSDPVLHHGRFVWLKASKSELSKHLFPRLLETLFLESNMAESLSGIRRHNNYSTNPSRYN